ncbi:MAG: hypothetical protein Q9184_005620 [Pyrenodesmia sp. 2 TL-2023]
MEDSINCLDYLKSKTQVDVDSLDIRVSIELGPFVDCTSNQADAYQELLNPRHADLLKKAAALANEIKGHYHSVNFEELAMELSMLSLATSIAPKITSAILIMVNPRYSYSTPKIIDNGQRLYRLCKFLEPSFDLSRLIIKVPGTWEGLQACRKLKTFNVKTLATTVFIKVEQILQLAGVHAFTAPAYQLRELASKQEPVTKLAQRSLFKQESSDAKTDGYTNGHTNGNNKGDTNGITNGGGNGASNGNTESDIRGKSNESSDETLHKRSFIDDESEFRLAFSRAGDGKAQMKLTQEALGSADKLSRKALNLFSDYQIKAEALMRDNDMTQIG